MNVQQQNKETKGISTVKTKLRLSFVLTVDMPFVIGLTVDMPFNNFIEAL